MQSGRTALWLILPVVAVACSDDFTTADSTADGDNDTVDRDLFVDTDSGIIVRSKERLLLRGTVVTPDQILSLGEVLVAGDRIVCVDTDCTGHVEADDASVIDTAGIIFPGLVDAHNHTQYNYLPRFLGRPEKYTNHNQWQGSTEYDEFIDPHRTLDNTLMCEMIKYGEIRSLVAGTTTIQGTPLRKCANTLIRNADLPYHGFAAGDTMRTNVLGVSQIDSETASQLLDEFQSGKTTAYVIHLAEGIDETARAEFDDLEDFGLLVPEVVIIHGTALGQAELSKVKTAGMPLIWSPSSNLDLYGATNDMEAVKALEILVALAPDWTPSGEPNVLDELQVAAELNSELFGEQWSDVELVRMVTSQAAAALHLEHEIGKLAAGMRADVLVLAGDRGAPYKALIEAELGAVELVVVRGKPLYGRPDWVGPLAPTSYCESVQICEQAKMICIKETEQSSDKFDQSLGDITAALGAYEPGILTLSTCD